MLFGITVNATMMLLGGSALLLLLIFQMLVGKRKIHFKGPLHMKVHRRVAWIMVVFAAIHGLAGLALAGLVSF